MTRQAFERWLRPKHDDYDEAPSMLFEAWQAATNAAHDICSGLLWVKEEL
jgi:hypothetical protein